LIILLYVVRGPINVKKSCWTDASALTNLDLEGDEFKETFDSEDAGEEYVHVIKSVAVLLRLALVLNTARITPINTLH